MAIDFKLPALGENIDSGDVVSLLVNEGDVIQANQNVVELETDKATVEIPCPHAGRVAKIHVQPGQSVPIGGVLLSIEESVGAAKAQPASAAPAAPAAKSTVAAAAAPPARTAPPASHAPARETRQPATADASRSGQDEPASAAAPSPPATRPSTAASNNGGVPRQASLARAEMSSDAASAAAPAGPSTRRLARELGVDLRRVIGTGPGGRITRDDIVAAVRNSSSVLKASPARMRPLPEGVEDHDPYGRIRRQPLSKIRKTIAANMARSAATIPHVTNFDDADITELERIRKASMADYAGSDLKLTMMPFVMKAVAQSLKLHPMLNASLDLENGQIIFKGYVNLGVAADTERGLVVPVVRDVDQLSIQQIASALGEVTTKARNNLFAIEDLRGGTFTISNLGAIGGTYSTPIINYPEVAVLLIGRSRQTPMAVDDRIEVRLMMPLSLSYDHRVIDGAVAARFLNEVKSYLQAPGRLWLSP
jgi:pyruvate dehydrogenase E2 component (dihydrolipoyllysine-residue acetyltransferase)